MAAWTRYSTFPHNYNTPSRSRALAAQILTHAACSVLDNETGKQLNCVQFRKHPKFQETWNKYFSNEMGILWQGFSKGGKVLGKRVEGTNTFYVISFEDIPKDRLKEVCYNSVVCEVRPGKRDPNRTRITICDTNVCYPGDVDTNTVSLELFKLMINSILSLTGSK